MAALEILAAVFMAVGCVFALTGSLGVLRMPDFYSRLHPAGKSDTLAQGLILMGLALLALQQLLDTLAAAEDGHGGHGLEWVGLANIILKLVLLTAMLFLTAPTATHAIAKAARLDRYTKLSVVGDAGDSRVAQIVVVGDIEERLEEESGPVLDVRDPTAGEGAKGPSDPEEPEEPDASEAEEGDEP